MQDKERFIFYLEKFNDGLNKMGMRATDERVRSEGSLTLEQDAILDNLSGLSDYFSGLIYPTIKELLD